MKITKKTRWQLPIFAQVFMLALVASLILANCELDPGPGPGGGGDGALGASLNLSGQVYVYDWRNYNYVIFTGNRQVVSAMGHGGSGSITNGQLSFSIGTPSNLLSSDWAYNEFFEGLNNVRINPTSTRFAFLELRTFPGDYYVSRENFVTSRTGNVEVTTYEELIYIYVDRDVNIRADRTVHTEWDYSSIVDAFNLNLKTGWNAFIVNGRAEYNLQTERQSETITVSVGNPGNHLRWVLSEPLW